MLHIQKIKFFLSNFTKSTNSKRLSSTFEFQVYSFCIQRSKIPWCAFSLHWLIIGYPIIEMKISKFLCDVKSGFKITNRFCWILKCHGYGRDRAWGKQEYSNIWLEGVNHWNVLLFYFVDEDLNKVQTYLQLPPEITDILILSYVFVT